MLYSKITPYRVYHQDIPNLSYERVVWFWADWDRQRGFYRFWSTPPYKPGVVWESGSFKCNYWTREHDDGRREALMSFIERSLGKRLKGPLPPTALGDPAFRKRYPALVEFLTEATMPDGSPRVLSRLTVFVEHGAWKVFLNDKQTNQSVCVTCDTFALLMDTLEATIQSDNPGWRELPEFERKGKKKG